MPLPDQLQRSLHMPAHFAVTGNAHAGGWDGDEAAWPEVEQVLPSSIHAGAPDKGASQSHARGWRRRRREQSLATREMILRDPRHAPRNTLENSAARNRALRSSSAKMAQAFATFTAVPAATRNSIDLPPPEISL